MTGRRVSAASFVRFPSLEIWRLRNFCLVLLAMQSTLAPPAQAGQRDWEPVVIKGAQLSPMLGTALSRLEVLIWRDGKFGPIPFQIDPAAPTNENDLTGCTSSIARDFPFQAADELVLMASDFGEQAPASAMVPVGAIELVITDPSSRVVHFAYLAAVNNPQRSAVTYVQYDATDERVETDFYRFGFSHGWPGDFADQGHRFEHKPSLIGGLRVSLSARVFGLIRYAMTERDLRISDPEVNCGPVRVTLRYRYAAKMIAGVRSPSIQVPISFYRQFAITPVTVHFPWLPRLFFRDTHIRINLEYHPLGDAALVWQGGGSGVPLEATSVPSIVMDPGPGVEWVALRQAGHLLVQAFPFSDVDLIQHRLTYRRAPNVTGDLPRQADTEEIGYELSRFEDLSGGEHVFRVCFAVLDAEADPAIFFTQLRVQADVTSQESAAIGR